MHPPIANSAYGGSTGAAPVLEVRDLSFAYELGRPVVESLSATLLPGRICALLGPNAVGKTTLLRLIMGHLEPSSGSVAVAGMAVRRVHSGLRAAMISYVPQRGAVSFAFTVQQVVQMGRYALRRDDAAVERAIAAADLLEQRHRVYHELSAGQQQRVLLARAMAQSCGDGQVMLLDEPGSMMDLWHVHRMMQTLHDLSRQGMAVLVVLHDLNLAARYADEVWLLDQRRLVAAGPWRQVLVPKILEPVYRVGLSPLTRPGTDRPVFFVEPSDRL